MRAAAGPARNQQALVGAVHREDGEDISDPVDDGDVSRQVSRTGLGGGLGDYLLDVGRRQ
jgi:hypothetical protein